MFSLFPSLYLRMSKGVPCIVMSLQHESCVMRSSQGCKTVVINLYHTYPAVSAMFQLELSDFDNMFGDDDFLFDAATLTQLDNLESAATLSQLHQLGTQELLPAAQGAMELPIVYSHVEDSILPLSTVPKC